MIFLFLNRLFSLKRWFNNITINLTIIVNEIYFRSINNFITITYLSLQIRLFGRQREDVSTLVPPTKLHYVSEHRIVKGRHSVYFDCDLFSEKYIEYCFVYVNQAINGAYTNIKTDCVPTLPITGMLIISIEISRKHLILYNIYYKLHNQFMCRKRLRALE